MNEAACNAFSFLQRDVVYCHLTVRERFELFAGQGDAQGGLRGSQSVPGALGDFSPGLLDPDFGF